MFIVCFDEKLKEKLKSSGFKLLNQNEDSATFIYNKSAKFSFNNIDKSKFMLTNRLIF